MAREKDEVVTDQTVETENAEQATDVATEQVEVTDTESENTSDTSTDGAEGTEGTEAKADEAKAEEPKGPTEAELLEAFKASVQATLSAEGRDDSTGVLPAAVIGPVSTAYSALGTSTKNKAKEYLQDQMTEAMTKNAFLDARSFLDLLNGLKSVKKETVGKPPVDPTEAHIAKVAALLLSPNLVMPTEGVKGDWQKLAQAKAQELSDQVREYQAWLIENADKPTEEQTEAPKVDDIVLAAAAAARGRSVAKKAASTGTTPRAPRAAAVSTGDGTRRNIAEHIKSAFAEVPVGTFLTIGEIVKHKSAEYGDDAPSQGAVAARLFPGGDASKCNVPHIKAEQRDKKGAVKVEDF